MPLHFGCQHYYHFCHLKFQNTVTTFTSFSNDCPFRNAANFLSPPQRLLFFKKTRKRGKGGKEGKGGKKCERKGKAKKAEIWRKLSISDRTQPECRLSFT